MIKFLFSFLVISSLYGSSFAIARDQQDTSVTVRQDTSSSEPDSVSATEVSYDSIYLPLPDTLFSAPGSIREVSGKLVSRYKNNPEYAYANDAAYWRKEPPTDPGLLLRILSSKALRWIFLTLFGGLILYGVYQLAIENNFTMLIRTRRKKAVFTELDLSEEKIDYEENIRINQAEGNYRMAIRFLYLRLIYILREKKEISYLDSSTNADITHALRNHPEAVSFRRLATAYEYVFYGGFIPNQEMYFHLKNQFEALQKKFSV
jgi:hypothetical protein